ncbi:hypothetical protein FQR65_LT19566 [Abscondita terminalis]|nr:hypothetical protein FQR65_LT19566 [Abscondita terminalis]
MKTIRKAKLTKSALKLATPLEEEPSCASFSLHSKNVELLDINQYQEISSDLESECSNKSDILIDDCEINSDASLFIESDEESNDTLNPKVLLGRRVVDIQHFLKSLKSLRHIGLGCSFFDVEVIAEKIEGFQSSLTFKCNVCGKLDVVKTSSDSASFGSVNCADVIGTLAIGIGYTQFSEMFAAMDIPQMSNKTYLKYPSKQTADIMTSYFRHICDQITSEITSQRRINNGLCHIPKTS